VSDFARAEQLNRLATYLVTPDPGQARDPASLGPPETYDRDLRLVVDDLLRRNGSDPQSILDLLDPALRAEIHAADPDHKPPEPVEIDMRRVDVPALPASVLLGDDLAQGASPWLDRYIAFSRVWSPRSYALFHVAVALWLLSTIAARRVVLWFGHKRFTNLYIALCAHTSLWAKSTGTRPARRLLAALGLDWLLASDDATPQKFIADLTLSVPADYDRLDAEGQARVLRRCAFSAQRGWFYEELGMKINAMMAPAGFMADFRGILRSLDDCPDRYEYGTIGRGTDIVRQPYLALLGNMTPADLRHAAQKHEALWRDGFWARWAFVTPPEGANRSRERFPEGECRIPSDLLQPVREWHDRLGAPTVDLREIEDDKGKPTGERAVSAAHLPQRICQADPDVIEALYAYQDGLLDVTDGWETHDLDGNYARFAEKALRIALLLASLENGGRVELRHFARAQGITEGWRASLHELYAQVNRAEPSEVRETEDRAVQIVEKLQAQRPPTAADVARYIWGASSGEVVNVLDGLVAAGRLAVAERTQKGTRRYQSLS